MPILCLPFQISSLLNIYVWSPASESGTMSVSRGTRRRDSPHSSRRSSLTLPRLGGSLYSPEPSDRPAASTTTSVLRFVYSEAVEKAFKRTYDCTAFGPFSAVPKKNPGIEIVELPQLYSDYLTVRALTVRNRVYAEKLLAEQDGLGELGNRLPRLSIKSGRGRRGSRRTSSIPSLPPLHSGRSKPDMTPRS